MEDAFGVSERRACRVIGFARSSCRYQNKATSDHLITARLKELIIERPRFGCPRLHVLLRNEGLVVNHKKTARIYRKAGLQLAKRGKKRRIRFRTRSIATATKPNERWSMDFMSDNLADGRTIRILTIVDEFSRECPALEMDTSLPAERVIRVLNRLAQERGLPTEIGVDQGPEFTSIALISWGKKHGVNLHFGAPGDKNENAFIESFNARLRDEFLNMNWFIEVVLLFRTLTKLHFSQT